MQTLMSVSLVLQAVMPTLPVLTPKVDTLAPVIQATRETEPPAQVCPNYINNIKIYESQPVIVN